MVERKTTEEVLKKYGAKIEKEIGEFKPTFSKNYQDFKQAMTPSFSRYEMWCKAFGNFISLKVSEKDRVKMERNIEIAHLNLTPSEVAVFAFSVLMITLFGGALLMAAIYLISGFFSVMLTFFFLVFSIFLFYFAYGTPQRLALQWRLKASSQMVPAILYIVIYMKHTSNFERAVAFAAEHLQPPLSFDFRKIFWDVEVGKFSSVKESVDHYLEGWRDYSLEFIEAFHLIESSLYEVSEERRIQVLEKSLQVILDGVYDKMLKYTHDVKSPLTNIYMLGIVLPTLALAILPLASSMLQGAIRWWHVMLIFNVLMPFVVMYLTNNIMMSRPGGHGEATLLEMNPLYEKYKSKKPFILAGIIVLPLFILGILPLLWAHTPLHIWLGMQQDYSWKEIGLGFLGNAGIFGINVDDAGNFVAGPFGILSILLSLFVPLSIALMFSIGYRMRTKELIKSRDQYKEVEHEFTSSLFQLGNRIGDGMPAEIAFSKVAESSRGTATEGFFRIVNQNIQQLGMSTEQALFNPKRGAVIFYPSELVSMSMKILVESVKKGLKVAARSLMSISEYVKNIRKIDERLNDLLADITADMQSNMTFLAPLLGGIIIGLAGMITAILASLEAMFQSGIAGNTAEAFGAGGLTNILGIFNVNQMIPTYFLQIVVGIYLVEIVFILTGTLVTVKSGQDTLEKAAETGKNMQKSVILYILVAFLATLGLALIGAVALSGLT